MNLKKMKPCVKPEKAINQDCPTDVTITESPKIVVAKIVTGLRKKGKHLGRPAKLTVKQRKEIARRMDLGAVGVHLAYEYNVSPGTIYRCWKQYGEIT